jgi:hypothetical protein
MKRDKHDALFSQLIREAYDWTCCWCGKYYPEGQRQGLHCSHLFSRRNKATRWHVWGAVAHCYGCHSRWGSNPLDGFSWATDFLGESRLEAVRSLAHSDGKAWVKAKEEIYAHNKKELERVLKLRKNGVRGVIELVPFDIGG